MSDRQLLTRLGLGPTWRLREAVSRANDLEPSPVAEPTSPVILEAESCDSGVTTPEFVAEQRSSDRASEPVGSGLDWPDLDDAISACRACRLCEQRTQAVPGVGDRSADWLFVGEGPGAEEDLRGEPFVGQAGKLLDAMLAALGVARGDGVYIANAVKCRPPNNRTPEADEIEACFPFLQRQIALIQPRVIVALGRPAAQALLKQEIRIGAARGKPFSFGDIPVVVTYHPAYLLRNPADKAKAWEDLCLARRTLAAQPARPQGAALSGDSLPVG
ncbi:hypothetical protein GCM10025771_40540 [Niveibacterium umoris]|uniref:Type-4 uracil-DNA glycosylase n=1 Tax=Niveibacterium umoris TaxID=1193620 RepID=A0A840BDH0_9RHOO|nr:uracil-DNA glycosylase [Niveibacterium umoris]MBB4010743.1 DNA polymerase [Niveibacterium umoris]